MQNYSVKLTCPASESFRCSMAANSVDLNLAKKLSHELNVSADIENPWNVGLIIGASGSGKTTLAREIFGVDCFNFEFDESKTVIDQFPEDYSYDDCATALIGMGLTSVPCWVRPVYTLSNGQKTRAVAALQMSQKENFVIDEWTSVVDRTVAKAMSNCLQKYARKNDLRVCVLCCHYDVTEWLNPDWIIDCNKQEFIDRRSLWQNFKRTEQLQFDVREVSSRTWKYFSKYHYLSDKLPGGERYLFGLFCGDDQIGFQCFANYTPLKNKLAKTQMHSNRTVIHPDYVGLGLGLKLINVTSEMMHERGFDVRAKFSSVPVAKAFEKDDRWQLQSVQRFTPKGGRVTTGRNAIKTYSYKFRSMTANLAPVG